MSNLCEKRLLREEQKVRILEEMIESKTRELYSEHQKSEQSNVFLNSILQSLSAGVIVMDTDYRILLVNEVAQELAGVSTLNLRGEYFFNSYPLEVNGSLYRPQQYSEGYADQFEAQLKAGTQDGSLIVSCSFSEIELLEGRRGIICLMQDISEMKKLERQLSRAQKLESVGQLAAGIAHEINTPIQYVRDNTVFIRDEFLNIVKLLDQVQSLVEALRPYEPVKELRNTILKTIENIDLPYLVEEIPLALSQSFEGAESVARIVRSMKTFSHPGSEERTLANINEAIESTVIVCKNEWKYVSDVNLDLAQDLPPVECFPGELNQVFLNLIINAAHAIGESTDNGKNGKGTITISTQMQNRSVAIKIADNGTGISGEILDKIFNPFFTTKEVGKGTGQGLAMVHEVITGRHHGTIVVHSEEGKGAEFVLNLPLTYA